MRRISNFTNPKSIVVYFILAIVLPSIMMGGLAFRGIKNDQALIERDNRRQAMESGGQIIESTEAILVNLEEEFEKIVLDHPLIQEAFFSDSLLEDFILRHDIVHGIFYVNVDDVKMLRSHLQYLPNEDIKTSQSSSLQINEELQIGWKYEYQDQDNKKALIFYQTLMPKLSDGYSRALVMNAIARLQKKTGAFEVAVASYKLLSQDYQDYRINKTMPLGLIADVELIKLHLIQGDTSEAIKVQINLKENLINRKWELDEVSYSLFATKTRGFINHQKINPSDHLTTLLYQLDSLRQKQVLLRLETRRLLSFREKIRDNKLQKNSDRFTPQRWVEEFGESACLISKIQDGNEAHWYVLTTTESLLNHYVKPLLREASAGGRW